jgi:hypothetical protein
MSAQLRVSNGVDGRTTLHPDTRLCLALVSAGLSALATLSPASRGAIVTSLDDSLASGLIAKGEASQALIRLRDQVNLESDPEAAMVRRLQEALFSNALSLGADRDAGSEPTDGSVLSFG